MKFTFSCCCFAGTRVFRVYAEDQDESERNSKITYSIVSTDDKFSIDPETGWVSTRFVRILGMIKMDKRRAKSCCKISFQTEN